MSQEEKATTQERVSPFTAIAVFFRQVIAELRKVVRPSRNELVQYSVVVLVFLVVMMAAVAGFDFGISWLSRLAFAG